MKPYPYKMTPEEYFRKIIELYWQSREPAFYNPSIFRGRSASISSQVEDLTALFISLNNPKQCNYFTDQAMKSKGSTSNKYPDIVIREKTGTIKHLIDVKTDMGWNRDGIIKLCEQWQGFLDSAKGAKTHFRNGKSKEFIEGRFSKNLNCHIIILSKINSGNKLDNDIYKVHHDKRLRNIRIYVMSDGKHPNSYNISQDELLNRELRINKHEFNKLMWNLTR